MRARVLNGSAAAGTPFSVIERGCRRQNNGRGVHAMLECYFDDSADPFREKYYACGGLIGAAEQWDWVEGRWAYETQNLQEPFRATDCECGHGQFKSWTKPRRDDLMARLTSVIRNNRLYAFASIVPIEAYSQAFPTSGEHDAFLLAVTQTIMNMAHIADLMKQDVGIWFERGDVVAAISAIFESVRRLEWKPASRLRSMHADSKELRPLQAADLVAREAFKHSDNLGKRPTRAPLRRLKHALYFTRWKYDGLKYLAAHGGPQNFELLSTWDIRTDAPKLEMFWKNF